MEMGDLDSPYETEYQGDGVTQTVLTPAKPLDLTSLTVTVAGPISTVTLVLNSDYTVDAQSGTINLTQPIAISTVLAVSGNAYRYFSDDDWTYFFTVALDQHLLDRTDETGQPVDLATLPPVEEYAVTILAITFALYALLNDASFDIDVSTPEGVHIPRGQRVEQLWHMLAGRQDQYNKIAAATNTGLNRIEMMELRRKSQMTQRFVPVYQTQEFQDTRFPRQLFPEINTDLLPPEPVPVYLQTINLVGYSNNDFSYTVTLDMDITGLLVAAGIRRYPAALTPMIFMTVNVLDVPTGQVQVTVSGRLMYYCGVSKFWDLQLVDASGNVQTVVGGTFDAIRQGNPAFI